VNRETKRMLQKQGSVNADGTPVRAARQAPAPKTAEERVSPGQYVTEVRGELKKVAWPTRDQVKNYTAVVVATLVVMTLLTLAYDTFFAKFVLTLFGQA
jgi:preprotein translocase subunit SecE